MSQSDYNREEKYAKVIISKGHNVFFERFISAVEIVELVIISPWITDLKHELISLEVRWTLFTRP